MRLLALFSLVAMLQACGPEDGGRGDAATLVDSLPAATGATPTGAAPGVAAEAVDSLPRVVFFGTSLTAGLGLPGPEDTYAARAAELAAAAGVPFTPVNAGVSGETTAAGLRRIDWVLQTPLDILVLELGANDGLRGLPVEQMEENLSEIVTRARARWPDVRVLLLEMEAPTNMGERYRGAFRDVFHRVAEEHGTRLVPFFLDGVAGIPDMNQSDGIHPTPQGHRVMARNILPELTDALSDVYAERAAPEAGGRR